MVCKVAWYSDKGSRLVNEDRVAVEKVDDNFCITVADGVGGHGGGSTAANVVTKRMSELFHIQSESFQKDSNQFLKEALDDINNIILRMQSNWCRCQATCVVLTLKKLENGTYEVRWAHVGDSRLYLFLNGKIHFITRDHSVVQLQREKKWIFPMPVSRSMIWQAMGEPDGISPEISETMVINDKATFLLCSDGVWDYVNKRQMEKSLAISKTPDEWLEYLKKYVNQKKSPEHDNNSAVAVFVSEQ